MSAENLCYKTPHDREKDAKKTARKLQKTAKRLLMVYRCNICKKWHVGVRVTNGGRGNACREFGVRD